MLILQLQFCFQTGGQFLESDLGGDNLNLSQDSLDDNIGVDQVMCHRFIGKGTYIVIELKPLCNIIQYNTI